MIHTKYMLIDCFMLLLRLPVNRLLVKFWEIRKLYMRSTPDRKSQEPYDFTHLWDIKLKATNEHTKTNKQKLIDSDNSTVVTKGKGKYRVKGVKYKATEGDLTLVGTQYYIQMMYHRTVHLKPI